MSGAGTFLARDFKSFILTGKKETERTAFTVHPAGLIDDNFYRYGPYCARAWMRVDDTTVVPVILAHRGYGCVQRFSERVQVLRKVLSDLGCERIEEPREVYHEGAWCGVYTPPKKYDPPS